MSHSTISPEAFANSYQSNKKTKTDNMTKSTNASRGSTSVIHRSGATPGISKDVKLFLHSNQETVAEVKTYIEQESCVCQTTAIGSKLNCLMYCVPLNSNNEPCFDPLYKAIAATRYETFKRNDQGEENERDGHLLRKVKETIVSQSAKRVENPISAPVPLDGITIPCFRSKCTEPVVEEKFKIKYHHSYILPTERVKGCHVEPLTFASTKLCRKGFAMLHGFSIKQIERACDRLKENIEATGFVTTKYKDQTLHPYNYSEVDIIFGDNLMHQYNNSIADKVIVNNMIHQDFSASCVRPFDDIMLTNAMLPANENDIDVALWLEDTFLTYGDSAPNKNIHQISATWKSDIFKLYQADMDRLDARRFSQPKVTRVDIKRFSEIWNACYPNYLVRPYANVTGKCDLCYAIDYQRRMSTDKQTKEALRQAHLLHRGGFIMPERRR